MIEKETLETINTVEEIATEIEITVGRSRTFLNILLNGYFDNEEANVDRCLIKYQEGRNLVGAVNDYVFEIEKKLAAMDDAFNQFWNIKRGKMDERAD